MYNIVYNIHVMFGGCDVHFNEDREANKSLHACFLKNNNESTSLSVRNIGSID